MKKLVFVLLILLTVGPLTCKNPTLPEPTPTPFRFNTELKLGLHNEDITVVEYKPAGHEDVVWGGNEDFVLRQSFRVPNTKGRHIKYIWTFIGLDRGDIAEVDINIYDGVVSLVHRSLHNVTEWDAWQRGTLGEEEYKLDHTLRHNLHIIILCRTNGKQNNPEHPRFGTLTTRPHYGIRMIWDPEKRQ